MRESRVFQERFLIALSIAAVLAASVLASAPEAQAEQRFFPAEKNGVPGQYGVVLNRLTAASEAPRLITSVGGKLGYVYRHVLNGFQAELTPWQAELLSRQPFVESVVQEVYIDNAVSYTLPHCYQSFATNTRPLPPLPGPSDPEPSQLLDCADPHPTGDCIDNWGIDRVDQSALPRDEVFTYRQDATGAKVFVIDTGIAASNREFKNGSGSTRVFAGMDTNCTNFPFNCGAGDSPCAGSSIGHGTHVAALIGGRTFGLARDVDLVPIRSLCSSYTSQHFKQGLEAVALLHSSSAPTAVVNLSGLNHCTDCACFYDTGCPNGSQIRQAMIALASRDNLLVVQSAGNNGADACDLTFGDEDRYADPADAEAIARIMIAAGSDESDGRWASEPGDYGHPISSAIGRCVDIFAPAAYVASAYSPADPGGSDPDEAVCQLSGTSMAAPHVSGVAAMILESSPSMSPDALRTTILYWGRQGLLDANPLSDNYIGPDSPNLLLHWDSKAIMRDEFETGDLRLWNVVQ